MCPDFLFFHGDETSVKVSIVDPTATTSATLCPSFEVWPRSPPITAMPFTASSLSPR
jgi:hypothetical protein